MFRRLPHRPGRGEDGQVGGLEGLVFGVLVFVLGTIVVANAWGLVDAKTSAAAAAREGARAFVEFPDSSSTAEALVDADAVARRTIAGYGRDPDRLVVVPESISLERCGRVTLRVEYPVPLLSIPLLGSHGHGFTAVGRHSEIVDPYRSGLGRSGSCPAALRP